MSNTFATLPVMAGDDVPAGPVDPIFNRLLKDRIIWVKRSRTIWPTASALSC